MSYKGYWCQRADERLGNHFPKVQMGRWKTPKRTCWWCTASVYTEVVGALLGGVVGVIRSVEREFCLSCFPRFLYCICIKAAVIAFVIFRFCMFCLLVALI